MTWTTPDLAGSVAVVTGASRGVGKGIALVLGECGATVHVTGRTTVDQTARLVTERGGRGIAERVDHNDAAQVEALAARVPRVDVLVVNAWGGYEGYDHNTFGAPFWEQPLTRWDTMAGAGVRSHYVTVRAFAPRLLEQRRGLVVLTGGWDDRSRYLGSVPYDVAKTATSRLVEVLAHELRPHGVAVVGVYPGFTRTEAVVAAFAAEGMQPPEETHSPEYVGRAVASLAADPDALALSGTGAQASWYAQRYGVRDVDGRELPPFVLPDESLLR